MDFVPKREEVAKPQEPTFEKILNEIKMLEDCQKVPIDSTRSVAQQLLQRRMTKRKISENLANLQLENTLA